MAARVSERGKIAALSFSLLCVSLLLTAYSARHPSVARVGTAALSQVVSPIYAVVDFAQDSLRSLWERYLFLVGVSHENEMLRARLNELEGSRGTLVELQSESARLRALLDLGSVSELRGVAAEVVGDEPSGWGQGVVVNKGSSHGIQVGMAVLHPKGIVGQVVAVAPNFSQVLLVTDHSSGVDALVQESRARGVVEGIGASYCELKYVSRQSPVRVGDSIITSGMDGVYPAGLPIGTVSKVAVETGTLLQNVEVKVGVDLGRLEQVLVVASGHKQSGKAAEAKKLSRDAVVRGARQR